MSASYSFTRLLQPESPAIRPHSFALLLMQGQDSIKMAGILLLKVMMDEDDKACLSSNAYAISERPTER